MAKFYVWSFSLVKVQKHVCCKTFKANSPKCFMKIFREGSTPSGREIELSPAGRAEMSLEITSDLQQTWFDFSFSLQRQLQSRSLQIFILCKGSQRLQEQFLEICSKHYGCFQPKTSLAQFLYGGLFQPGMFQRKAGTIAKGVSPIK